MQTIIGLAAAALLAIFIMGTWNSPSIATPLLGTVVLHSVNNSGVQGTVTITADGSQNTFVQIQAQGLATLTTADFGLFTSNCGSVQLQLNPLEATAAGDASSISQLVHIARDHWWFGIRQGKTILACGDLPFSGTGTPQLTPTLTPSGGISVPVQGSPTPIPSDGTVQPAGS